MTEWPKSVTISPEGERQLIQMLKSTYTDVYNEIATSTDFGVYRRKQILSQISTYLQQLNADLTDFTQKQVPIYYSQGADDAVAQLTELGAPIAVATGFNQIHEQAIASLVSDQTSSFGEAMQGVYRSTSRMLGSALRQQLTQDISKGITAGDALRDVVTRMKQTLRENGLTALVGSNGRQWSLQDYSEMLFRTKMAEARNLGMVNRMAENGYDLVQVSSHGASDVCGEWEGKILSTTGETKTFEGEAVLTVNDALESGLFHPNCKHALNAIAPDVAKDTVAYTGQTDEDGNPIYAKGSLTWTRDNRQKEGLPTFE